MTEHDFQCDIVLQLDNKFEKEIKNEDVYFTAVPNGGRRDKRTGAKLKREGVKPGVSDIIMFYFGKVFCLEIKLPPTIKINRKTGKQYKAKGYQSESQKEFQSVVEHQGHEYWLIDSNKKFEEFLCMLKNQTVTFKIKPPKVNDIAFIKVRSV